MTKKKYGPYKRRATVKLSTKAHEGIKRLSQEWGIPQTAVMDILVSKAIEGVSNEPTT